MTIALQRGKDRRSLTFQHHHRHRPAHTRKAQSPPRTIHRADRQSNPLGVLLRALTISRPPWIHDVGLQADQLLVQALASD
jgi:hypothetical protein